MQKIGSMFVFFFLGGLLIPELVILDFIFGFGYYIVDSLGYWQPGMNWVVENRGIVIFCFLIFPLICSGMIAWGIVHIFQNYGDFPHSWLFVLFF